MEHVLAAILWLAPHLGVQTAGLYARSIQREARAHRVDPLLLVAIIHTETSKSWDTTARSSTSDWGLGQVHVSATTHPQLLGREEELLRPEVGLHYAAATLSMWMRYHTRACVGRDHLPWAHYASGYRTGLRRVQQWAKKVGSLYEKLKIRFLLREERVTWRGLCLRREGTAG